MGTSTCNKCGWVHFEVDLAHIKHWQEEWKELVTTKGEEWLSAYGIKDRKCPSDDFYYKCFRCGNSYKDFRDYKEGDCHEGSTLNPILGRSYDLV